jgi:hypothetical protein
MRWNQEKKLYALFTLRETVFRRKKAQNTAKFFCVDAGFLAQIVDVDTFWFVQKMVGNFGVRGDEHARRLLELWNFRSK